MDLWGAGHSATEEADAGPCNPPLKTKQVPEEWGQALLITAKNTEK